MRVLIAIVVLISLFECADRQAKNSSVTDVSENERPFVITAIEGKFPFRLDEIDLGDKNNTIQLGERIVSEIEETVKEYANDVIYDSSGTYQDTYINTIRLQDSLQTIFLVLLKHYTTGELFSRVLFYDNKKNEFTATGWDFKLHALYEYDDGKLIPTNLKTLFKIASPEIERIDFNKDGVNDYKFTRLWHNGTFNSIHTTVLTIKNSTFDTLYFCEKELGELAGKKDCL